MPLLWKIETFADRDISVLRLTGDLDFDMRGEFSKALDELLATSSKKLVLDLSKISRMSSVFIGSMVDYGGSAASKGKTISCMLREKMARVCVDAGIEKVITVISVEE
ncbi:MAG: STAS domain-containing protein [Planctomycetes bacterium]|nr:STAS domain-containing protein [Planctomycetota bacterium]